MSFASTSIAFSLTLVGLIWRRQPLINESKLAQYLRRLEEGYPDGNPYHCRIHAADVVRSLYCILTQGGVLKAIWPEGEDTALMVALFSAAIHDYEHKGLNVSAIYDPSMCMRTSMG